MADVEVGGIVTVARGLAEADVEVGGIVTVARGLAEADVEVGGVVMIARARRKWPTTLSLWIDVEDGAGNKLGPGPIRDFTSWRSTTRLDRAGGFSFEMPAANERAALVQEKRVVRCYGVRAGAVYEVGAGIIDLVTTRVDADGRAMLRVQGDDLLRELTYRSVAFLEIDDGAGGPGSTALDDVLDFAPAGWALDEVNGYGETDGLVYARFAGESVLTALNKIADHLSEHFRLGVGRQVVWMQTDRTESGVRAVQTVSPSATTQRTNLALITALERIDDSYSMISRVYPYGAGEGMTRLTLAACNETPPAGYTLSTTENYIRRDATESTFGRMERYLQWKEIAPISNTSADLQAASNALYGAALAYLQRVAEPYASYRLQVAKLDREVYPGSTVRVVYREMVDGLAAVDIDADLVVLEATTEIDQDGIRTVGMVVATTDRWPASDQEMLISQIQQGIIFQAHPQLNANSYTTHYSPHVDADTPAEFRFRLGAEVAQVQQVLLEFELLPLTSTIRTISGSSTTTANGGAATVSSESGGSDTVTSESGGGDTVTSASGGGDTVTSAAGSTHVHTITIDDGDPSVIGGFPMSVVPSPSGDYLIADGTEAEISVVGEAAHTHGVTIGSHTHGVTIGSHTHGVTIGNHTHDVVIAAHTHDVVIANHTHDLTPNISTVYGVYNANSNTVFLPTDLDYQVNGGSWLDLNTDLVNIGGGWYQLDLTALVSSTTTFRPNQATNTVKIRRKTSGSFASRAYAQIDGLLQVRNIIQSVAYL